MQAKTKRLEMRFPEETLQEIDQWRGRQHDVPSRSEAIRRLIDRGLAGREDDVRFSPGETLLITLLCDIHKALQVDSDVDTRLIREAIAGGHLWGLKQAYSGLFHDEIDDPQDVTETVDILEMWIHLRDGLEELDGARRKAMAMNIVAAGGEWEFSGFDANSEPHYRIVRFLIDQLGRYTDFRALELNSRTPMLARYRRMLQVYRPIQRASQGRSLTEADIERVLRTTGDRA